MNLLPSINLSGQWFFFKVKKEFSHNFMIFSDQKQLKLLKNQKLLLKAITEDTEEICQIKM